MALPRFILKPKHGSFWNPAHGGRLLVYRHFPCTNCLKLATAFVTLQFNQSRDIPRQSMTPRELDTDMTHIPLWISDPAWIFSIVSGLKRQASSSCQRSSWSVKVPPGSLAL